CSVVLAALVGGWAACSNSNDSGGPGSPDAGPSDAGRDGRIAPNLDSGEGDDGGALSDDGPNLDGPPSLDCNYYCAKIHQICGYEEYINARDGSPAPCLAECALFPAGTLSDTSGDSLGCRINDLLGISPNCSAAGPYGRGPLGCGNECT